MPWNEYCPPLGTLFTASPFKNFHYKNINTILPIVIPALKSNIDSVDILV